MDFFFRGPVDRTTDRTTGVEGVHQLIGALSAGHRARVFFHPLAAHACDVCRAWESCGAVCGAAAGQRAEDRPAPRAAPDAASANALSLTAIVAAMVLALAG